MLKKPQRNSDLHSELMMSNGFLVLFDRKKTCDSQVYLSELIDECKNLGINPKDVILGGDAGWRIKRLEPKEIRNKNAREYEAALLEYNKAKAAEEFEYAERQIQKYVQKSQEARARLKELNEQG